MCDVLDFYVHRSRIEKIQPPSREHSLPRALLSQSHFGCCLDFKGFNVRCITDTERRQNADVERCDRATLAQAAINVYSIVALEEYQKLSWFHAF